MLRTPIIKQLLVVTLLSSSVCADAQSDTSSNKDWIIHSNAYTKTLIDIEEKYAPEFGSQQGQAYFDTLISVPTLVNDSLQRQEMEQAVAQLRAAKTKETNPAIKQDLDILIG